MAKVTPNPKKRSFTLPRGCKDLIDLLNPSHPKSAGGKKENLPAMRVNGRIKAPRVDVRDAEGRVVGVMSLADALDAARKQAIDLVELDSSASPPLCVLIDYGVFRSRFLKRQK